MVNNMRRITILRPGKIFGSAMRIRYYIDGETKVATAKRGETVTFELDENEHTLRAHMGIFSKRGTSSNMVIINAGNEDKEFVFYFDAPKMFSANICLAERKPEVSYETEVEDEDEKGDEESEESAF